MTPLKGEISQSEFIGENVKESCYSFNLLELATVPSYDWIAAQKSDQAIAVIFRYVKNRQKPVWKNIRLENDKARHLCGIFEKLQIHNGILTIIKTSRVEPLE